MANIATAVLNDTQSRVFWNIFRNAQNAIENPEGYDYNREVLTYIQADDRYMTYLDSYLDKSDYTATQKNEIRTGALEAHEQAKTTINDPDYYFSTDIYAMSQDMYWGLENEQYDIIGDFAQAPNNPFKPDVPVSDNPDNDNDPEQTTALAPIDTRIDQAHTMFANTPSIDLEDALNAPDPIILSYGPVVDDSGLDGRISGGLSPDSILNILETPNLPEVAEGPIIVPPTTEPLAPSDLPYVSPIQAADILMPEHPVQNVALEETTTDQIPIVISGNGAEDSQDRCSSEDTRDNIEYEVQSGDNLWKIAKDYYGLTKNAEIQQAAATIAKANGLDQGTRANHINVGDVLKLPDNPNDPTAALNWGQLDKDPTIKKSQLGSNFNREVENQDPDRFNRRPDAAAPCVQVPALTQ